MRVLIPHQRFFVVVLSLSFALFVLFLSLWRVNLAAVGNENHESSATPSAQVRLSQLLTPPILPDHPLYVVGMVADRIDLMFSPKEKQFGLRLQYANVRLATAQLLIARGQLNVALSTTTKAEKYLIAAAADIPQLPPEKQVAARLKLSDTITLHKTQLTAMKAAFSDSGRSIVDGLIEQVLVLRPDR